MLREMRAMVVEQIRTRLSKRADSVRNLVSKEADTIGSSVKRVVDGGAAGVRDLLSLKPVQAVSNVAEGVVDGGLGLISGTAKNVLTFVREQAQITREWERGVTA